MSPRAAKPKRGNRNAVRREASEKAKAARRSGGAAGAGGTTSAGRGRGGTSSTRGATRNAKASGSTKGAGDARPVRRSGPKGLGGEQVEGRQAVRELLLAGRRKVNEVLIAAEQDENEILSDIADLARDLGVPCREISRPKFGQLARTEAPQGVLAKARPLPELPLEELTASRKGQPAPFLVAVDGVTDPGNLGALLRSAECAGVTGVVLPRHRAVHVTPTVTKAAAGAVEYLPMGIVGGLPTAITEMQQAGITVIGLDMGGDTLFELDARATSGGVCLVLGAEGAGLSRLVRQRCDVVASLPLLGTLSSLNVAAAAAVAVYEIARRRGGGPATPSTPSAPTAPAAPTTGDGD